MQADSGTGLIEWSVAIPPDGCSKEVGSPMLAGRHGGRSSTAACTPPYSRPAGGPPMAWFAQQRLDPNGSWRAAARSSRACGCPLKSGCPLGFGLPPQRAVGCPPASCWRLVGSARLSYHSGRHSGSCDAFCPLVSGHPARHGASTAVGTSPSSCAPAGRRPLAGWPQVASHCSG